MPEIDFALVLNLHQPTGNLEHLLDGIVKLFENDCGAVDVSLFGGQIYWLTRSFMPLRWQ